MKTSQHKHSTEAIVIGGGVLGLLSARELVISGIRVTLIERKQMAQESSWAGGGILSPLYPWLAVDAINALSQLSQAEYPLLAESLRKSTGIDPEWIQSGMLYGDCHDLDLAVNWCKTRNVDYQIPKANPTDLNINAQFFLPNIAQIRNPYLLKALQADLIDRGVHFIENEEVAEINVQQERLEGIKTNRSEYKADLYLIAAGAWSSRLCPELDLNVEPVKGQMLIYKAQPDLLKNIVLNEGNYLIPRKDGRILVGSTLEYTQFDKSTSEAARFELEKFAHKMLPSLKDYEIEKHWAGLRPGTPEGIPIISRHPSVENLYFNCGHFRNGFNIAPASARLLVDIMLNRLPIISPKPYVLEC